MDLDSGAVVAVVAAVAALLITALAACSSDSEGVSPIETTSAAPTPTSTTDAEEQAVIEKVRTALA